MNLELLAYLGLGLMCASCLLVGVRLARIHLRTNARPELLVSVALIAIGPLGFVLSVACEQADGLIHGLGPLTWGLASASLCVGTLAVAGFTWTVFHPASRWARSTCALIGLCLVVCFVGEWAATGFWVNQPASRFTRMADWIRTGTIFWGAIASLSAFGAARKRVALGLAEPGVALRIGLWGLGLLSVAVVGFLDSAVKSAGAPSEALVASMRIVNSSAGLIAAAALQLSFQPGPTRVTRWLEDAVLPARDAQGFEARGQ